MSGESSAKVTVRFRLVDDTLLVRFACTCGTMTGWLDVRGDSGAAIRRHLAEEHSAVVGFGICAGCGAVTDYFHAHVPDLDTDVWACERCGPKVPTVVDQAGAGDQLEVQH